MAAKGGISARPDLTSKCRWDWTVFQSQYPQLGNLAKSLNCSCKMEASDSFSVKWNSACRAPGTQLMFSSWGREQWGGGGNYSLRVIRSLVSQPVMGDHHLYSLASPSPYLPRLSSATPGTLQHPWHLLNGGDTAASVIANLTRLTISALCTQ